MAGTNARSTRTTSSFAGCILCFLSFDYIIFTTALQCMEKVSHLRNDSMEMSKLMKKVHSIT